MDYDLQNQLMTLMNAANVTVPSTVSLTQLVIFRECWTIADLPTKQAFARDVLGQAAKIMREGWSNQDIGRMAMTVVGPDMFATEEAKVRIAAACVDAACKQATENRYGGLGEAVAQLAKDAVNKIAPEHAAEVEAKLRDHVTAAMLDEAVKMAAARMASELRRKVEEAQTKALPEGATNG